jgi:hypothetical protein
MNFPGSVTRPVLLPGGTGSIAALGERLKRAGHRRAGRLRVALLIIALFLPLLLTSLLGHR